MQVRFRNPARDACPVAETIMVPPSQTFLTPNAVYEVFAASIYKGIVFLLVHDDSDMPSFYPRSFFELTESSLPADWICNLFPDDVVQFVLGPPYIAKDRQSYSDMANVERSAVEEFFRRKVAAEKAAENADE